MGSQRSSLEPGELCGNDDPRWKDRLVLDMTEQNGRCALTEYPEVACVESQYVCPCTVCWQHFLGTSFEFADLAHHWACLVGDVMAISILPSFYRRSMHGHRLGLIENRCR